jgi:hypothetical protein
MMTDIASDFTAAPGMPYQCDFLQVEFLQQFGKIVCDTREADSDVEAGAVRRNHLGVKAGRKRPDFRHEGADSKIATRIVAKYLNI